MKRLLDCANLPEAHLLAEALAGQGIRVRLLNSHAAGALGELPADAASPQLWLDDERDEARARQAIDAIRARAAGPVRACPGCGEENPPAFDLCWCCGRALPP